jgi:hypothetical protein
MFGFMILFGLALFGRLMSWRCFRKQYEPKIKLKKGYYFSFWDLFQALGNYHFRALLLAYCERG